MLSLFWKSEELVARQIFRSPYKCFSVISGRLAVAVPNSRLKSLIFIFLFFFLIFKNPQTRSKIMTTNRT